MTVIDPNTGLLITCQPWEYAELCRQHGWIKTTYETNTTPSQKYDFTPPEEKTDEGSGRKPLDEETRRYLLTHKR